MFLKLSSGIIELTWLWMLRLLPKLRGLSQLRAAWAGLGAVGILLSSASWQWLTHSFRQIMCPGRRSPHVPKLLGPQLRPQLCRHDVCWGGYVTSFFRRFHPLLAGAAWHAGACSPPSCDPRWKHSDTRNSSVICVYSATNMLVFGRFQPGIFRPKRDGLQH